MLVSNRCIHGFMSNLIKKSWTDSNPKPPKKNSCRDNYSWKYGIQLQFREAFHRLFDSCNNHRRKYCGKGNQKMCEKQYQNEEAFYQHGQTMFRTTMRTFLGQSISQFQTQFTNQTVSWQRCTCRNSSVILKKLQNCLLTYKIKSKPFGYLLENHQLWYDIVYGKYAQWTKPSCLFSRIEI